MREEAICHNVQQHVPLAPIHLLFSLCRDDSSFTYYSLLLLNFSASNNNMPSTLLTAADCKTWPHGIYGTGSRVESLSLFDLHSPV